VDATSDADALKFDFSSLAGPESLLRVAGNLTHNISTSILFHLLEKAVLERMEGASGLALMHSLDRKLQLAYKVRGKNKSSSLAGECACITGTSALPGGRLAWLPSYHVRHPASCESSPSMDVVCVTARVT
jgi:hypothetical protein